MYKKGSAGKFAESVADLDDDIDPLEKNQDPDVLPVETSLFNLNGKPFSAVHHDALPRYFAEPTELFDEFGFRLTENSDHDAELDIEISHHRMKWLAHIQFSHEHVDNDLLWSDVVVDKLRGAKLDGMLRTNGIPHSLRPFLWVRFSGAAKKKRSSGCPYSKINARCERDASANIDGQIDKDLLRTLPTNLCFSRQDAPGVAALRRVLKTVAFMYPDLGYCQGMGVVVATLLLVMGEEMAFWTMCALIEDILPPNFYSHSLLGLQADERVVKHLMCIHTPGLVELIKEHDVDVSMVSINWLLTIFATIFPMRTILRIWDFLFVEGSVIVFRVIVAMLKMREPDVLLAAQISDACPADIFNSIVKIPTTIVDMNNLVDHASTFEESITPEVIAGLRKKYQGMLMADSGMIFEAPSSDGNLPKQKMTKRRLSRSKSLFSNIFHSAATDSLIDEDDATDPKTKNIRQTEMVVDLRNAIHQICRHFSLCPEKHEKPFCMLTDYSVESHDLDREHFLKARREGKKRARALLDFQRQEEDELGFQKNDIINIVSEKDEHCWIGEVNGQRGWFPAKFVKVIDERGKNYCVAGDEAVDPKIGEIVRGQFANALARVLHHGIRETNLIMASFVAHPWPFIETLSNALVEKKSRSVNSKLTLCDTFKLDQDGQVLSPEELLYRAVSDINHSHNSVGAPLDVKLRSLITYALNEQCLHLWFEVLCASNHQNVVRERYYHSDAFVRSPAWKQVGWEVWDPWNSHECFQIKCELRLLAQFSFNLSVDAEICAKPGANNGMLSRVLSMNQTKNGFRRLGSVDASGGDSRPLKEGVRDMLIKHHLFSWDL